MSDATTKRCVKCKELLELDAFYAGRARCKPCLRPQLEAYREANVT